MVGRTRAIALDGLAHLGAPSPVDAERQLLRAWQLFTTCGAPEDPGWAAVAHDLGEGDPDQTGEAYLSALALLEVADTHSGIVIWAGGVGSGRSYAAALMLWRMARRLAAGHRVPMGRWVDAPELGSPGQWRDRGSTAKTWPELLEALAAPKLVVIDDAGAEGSTAKARERVGQLLQRRHRGGLLTLVTTNAPKEAHVALFGGRVVSRADTRWLRGADRRDHRLAPTPKAPFRIVQAEERMRATDALDRAIRTPGWDDRRELVSGYVSAWLRGRTRADEWAARVEAHAKVIAAREAELGKCLASTVAKLAAPATGPSEAEELEALRETHHEKLARLAAKQDPDTLREALAKLEPGAQTPTELAAVEAIKEALREAHP